MPRKTANKSRTTREAEYIVPTEQEWNKMLKYGSFRVSDGGDNDFRFTHGDTATILPNGKPPGMHIMQNEYWVGDIVEIRGVTDEDGSNDVWAQVRWWYSPQDVKGVVQSFDTTKCSPYERIYSDHIDFVSPEAFNEVIKMHPLRDDDPTQPYIAPDDFHSRYEIHRKLKRLDPKPGASSCICSIPYEYHDVSTVMHFCPRPSCRRWYHESCLVDASSLFDFPAARRPSKPKRGRAPAQKAANPQPSLLLTSPDTSSTLALPTSSAARATKRRRISLRSSMSTSPRKSRVTLEDPIQDSVGGFDREDGDLQSVLGKLPAKLVSVASQPIVRGSLYTTGGVSGNVRPVVRARRLVYEILGLTGDDDAGDGASVEYEDPKTGVEQGQAPSDWEERVLGPESRVKLEVCVVKIKGTTSVPVLACPECKSAI